MLEELFFIYRPLKIEYVELSTQLFIICDIFISSIDLFMELIIYGKQMEMFEAIARWSQA